MKLFKNRPLAVVCTFFISTCAILYTAGLHLRLIVAAILATLFFGAVVAVFLPKGDRVKKIFASLCLFGAFLAPLSQILLFDLPRERALREVGEQRVIFSVESVKHTSEYSSEYGVRVEEIEGDRVSLRSVAVTGFKSELEIGDRVFAKAEITPAGESLLGYVRHSEEDVYIELTVYEENEYLLVERKAYTIRGIFNILRDRVSEFMERTLGEETSALCRGFLLGDKSGIGSEVIRDFRRSGVSHLLSVSGLHVSVILGAIGYLLMKLSLPKKLRCVILSAVALVFLGMTGFSMSASRSVIMTLSVYFTYLLVKESDSITALFLSVAVIILIFPHAVRDVGLALSFLATLGILAAYMPVATFLHRRREKGVRGGIRYLFEKVLFAVLLTFICNSFICIVVWLVFGEISVIGLVSNSILSPASELFIIVAPIACLISGIPLLGDGAVLVTEVFGKNIVFLAELFSRVHGAVISLRYPFAGILIILMSIAIAVMLVIELKRKWTIILPPIATVLAFAICLCSYGLIHRGETVASYESLNENEMIIFTKGYSAAVCDISSGSHSFLEGASETASENKATEISEYIVTHYHKRHIATLERLFRETLMHRIYLPEAQDPEESEILEAILESAELYGVEAKVYRGGERLEVLDGWAAVIFADVDGHRVASVAFSFGEEMALYVGAGEKGSSLPSRAFYESSYLIFGKHGGREVSGYAYSSSFPRLKRVFFADREMASASKIDYGEAEVFAFERRASSFFEIILE
ncbi:MAG: ComEC/Rec2 family competence protein [Ruminococcaceae bacterium]|nr:ComEC/Rec2 family competence protein [Oscillospiraceae bacterium]